MPSRMEWFYAGGAQPVGPVSEAQFDELVRTGAIGPDTLVWKQGMASWQPLQTVTSTPITPNLPAKAQPQLNTAAACSECGQTFPTGEMIQLGGAWVCARCKPVFLQRLREGVTPPSSTQTWRDGKTLVMARDSTLPARCAKCNKPVSRPPIKRTLYWHVPWIYLLILVSLLIYIIVALIIRKKAVVFVPVCDEHRQQRYQFIAASWLMVLAGVGCFFYAVNPNQEMWALAGVGLIIAAIVLGLWKGVLVSAKKIDDRFVHVGRFCAQYLEGLPEWTGPR